VFSAEFPRFQSAELGRAYPDFYLESPHNFWLDALTAQGVPGLVLLAAFLAFGLLAARRTRWPGAFAGAALVATLATHLFAVWIVPVALYFYAVLAILAASPATTAHSYSDAPPRRRWLRPVSATAAAVLTVFAVRLTLADRALLAVQRNLEGGRLAEAAAAYERVRRWRAPAAAPDLWYSRKLGTSLSNSGNALERLQAWPGAVEAAVRATRTAEDRHNAWYNLAMFYAAQDDPARTEGALRAAAAAAPNWFKPHWMLARLLALAGRHEDALAEAQRAAELNGGKDLEVAQTLDEISAKVGQAK
jgi:hypothetical protein